MVASRMSLHHRGEGSPNLKGILPATRDAVYCPKDDNVRCQGVLRDHPVVTPRNRSVTAIDSCSALRPFFHRCRHASDAGSGGFVTWMTSGRALVLSSLCCSSFV